MIDAVAVGMVIVAVGLLLTYRVRRRRIAAYARQATAGAQSMQEVALALGRAIFGGVKRGKNPVFGTRLLAPLGASPPRVLMQGGCCSGITRLYVTSLETLGIRSARITVYRQPGPVGVHCLAQVETSAGSLIIDPDYGVWFRHPDGGPIDIRHLRQGVPPAVERFVFDREAAYLDSPKTRPSGYPDRDYYRFDFSETRTANWTMSSFSRLMYRVLNTVSRGRVNYLLRPPILEWPEILLAVLLLGVALDCEVIASVLRTGVD